MDIKNKVKETFDLSLEVTLRLFLVFGVLYLCFEILKPFLIPVIWGAVIAISIFPVHKILSGYLGGRTTLSSVLITLTMIAIIVLPSLLLAESLITGLKQMKAYLDEGTVPIPPPSESVKTLPIIGNNLYENWELFSSNLEAGLKKYESELIKAGQWLFGAATKTGAGILQLVLSIIVSGVFLAYQKGTGSILEKVVSRVAGPKGYNLLSDSRKIIQSVTRGILGVALIQSLVMGLVALFAGIPFAALWAVICFFFGIIQIGALPVGIPLIIYSVSTMDTLPATLTTIAIILTSLIDNVLKPILLGKGAPAPMIVVFLGAIGGFIFAGIIGLFLGAVFLTLGYKLFHSWLETFSEEELKQVD